MQRHWLIPQGRHDPFYPQSQLPLSFLSTTLPLCCCPSNEEVRHRRRHNTPLHKEGMSVCQMGRGDYNMFPLPWWLNGAGMRTHLIQAGSFPWQNYESQFLRRKCTYPQPWGKRGIFGWTHKGRSEKQLRQDNWAGSWPHKLLEALISPQQ